MKTNNWKKLLMATLWLGMCAVPAMAQKNIDKIVEELEKRDDVSISLVTNRNPETRKVTNVVKSISCADEKITQRLIEAFEKDEEYTVTAIKDSKKVNGKPKASYMYIFRTDEGQYNYSLDIKTNGKVEISVIFKPQKQGKDGKAVSMANLDLKISKGLQGIDQLISDSLVLELDNLQFNFEDVKVAR